MECIASGAGQVHRQTPADDPAGSEGLGAEMAHRLIVDGFTRLAIAATVLKLIDAGG